MASAEGPQRGRPEDAAEERRLADALTHRSIALVHCSEAAPANLVPQDVVPYPFLMAMTAIFPPTALSAHIWRHGAC